MHNMEPSHVSAYNLYKLYAGRADVENAIKYMTEAIENAESDAVTDGGYQYELAAFCYKNNQTVKADAAAKAAMELDPSLAGKANMLLGTIWGSLVCSGNDVEQRAKYWVAVDYMNKAKAADESLAEDANNMIRQYSAYYPQTAEAFMYDVTDGQSYTVSCGGLRATTTVRTQK
jgi:tetratricopeptide (TPR) repeat protein